MISGLVLLLFSVFPPILNHSGHPFWRVAVLVLHLFSVTLHHKRCRMYRCVCILVQDFIFNTRPEDILTMPSYIVIEMPLNNTVYSISSHLEFCSHI